MGPVRPSNSTPEMKLKSVEPSFQGNSSSQDRFLGEGGTGQLGPDTGE